MTDSPLGALQPQGGCTEALKSPQDGHSKNRNIFGGRRGIKVPPEEIAKVSALVRGRVEGYRLDRLFRLLNALGQRVEITVRPNAAAAESRAVVVTWEEGG
jgi:hypothetical protein